MTGEKRGISASAQRAREILSQNGNRITLIGALLVWMASFLIYRFLFTGIGLLATLFYLDTGLWNFLLTGGYLVLSLLYTQLVVIPLFYGVMLVAHGMSRGESVPLAEIFLPFAQKKSYRRAIRLADGFLWRALVAIILGDVVCVAVKASLRSAFLAFVICFLIVVGEIFLCMVIGRRYFRTLLIALEYPDAHAPSLVTLFVLALFYSADPFGNRNPWDLSCGRGSAGDDAHLFLRMQQNIGFDKTFGGT